MTERPDPSEPCWAIIPARGGSKGVPGKNLRALAGQSLIARCVTMARRARMIERVFVTTDDPAIAAEAERAGAGVIQRPAELAGDTASSESALLHALDSLAAQEPLPGITVFLQCTAPLTRPEDVDGCLHRLVATRADSAFSVARFHGFVWRETAGSEGALGVNHDRRERLRRQDRPDEYVETGAVYAFRTEGFRAFRHRFFGRTVLYEVPAERHLDIDSLADLAHAEAVLQQMEAEDPAKDRSGVP